MKQLLIAWLAVLAVLASTAAAEDPAAPAEQAVVAEGAAIPDFDKIRTPDSPAFTLLGVSPTQIERPTTPKELTAVVSKFSSEGDAVIPKNLAVEFSPFAIVSSYQKVDTYLHRSRLDQLWQNATISAATATSTREVAGMTHVDASLGLGLRTMLALSGGPQAGCTPDDLQAFVALAGAEAITGNAAGAQLEAQKLADIQAKITELGRPLNDAELQAITDAYVGKELQLKLGTVQQDKLTSLCIKEIASAHRGWIMDVALATGFIFPDSVADAGRYSLGALWTDVAYEGANTSFVVLGRVRDDKTTGLHDYTSDVGVRGIIAKDAYAGSVEAIWRHSLSKDDGITADDDQYRLALALDVHLTDGTWLTLSFGKDFSQSEAGSLFSLANLKYGLGDPKVKR